MEGQAAGVEGAEGLMAALTSMELAMAIELIAPVMARYMVMFFAIEMTDKYVSDAGCCGILITPAAENARSSVCQCLETDGQR